MYIKGCLLSPFAGRLPYTKEPILLQATFICLYRCFSLVLIPFFGCHVLPLSGIDMVYMGFPIGSTKHHNHDYPTHKGSIQTNGLHKGCIIKQELYMPKRWAPHTWAARAPKTSIRAHQPTQGYHGFHPSPHHLQGHPPPSSNNAITTIIIHISIWVHCDHCKGHNIVQDIVPTEGWCHQAITMVVINDN